MVPLTLVKYDDFTNSQIVNYTVKIVGAFFYSSVKARAEICHKKG